MTQREENQKKVVATLASLLDSGSGLDAVLEEYDKIKAAPERFGLCHDIAVAIIVDLHRRNAADGWLWCRGAVDGGMDHSWVEYGGWCIDMGDDDNLRVWEATHPEINLDGKVVRRNAQETLAWVREQERRWIAEGAYFRWRNRGCGHGRDREDWFDVERQILGDRQRRRGERRSHDGGATIDVLPRFDSGTVDCPLGSECPLRRSGAASSETAEAHAAEEGGGPTIVEALRVGGAAAGQGTNAFLNLVAQTKHGHGEDISMVITTDRFFHDSLGEDGNGKGYDVLLRLLDVLGVLRSRHPLTLQVSPSGNSEKVDAFARRIQGARPGLTVASHASVAGGIHDRFYLFKSRKEVGGKQLSGVFGPSLNGLDAGLYLMGSFEDEALKRVAAALNL